jgi:hypothetical protein
MNQTSTPHRPRLITRAILGAAVVAAAAAPAADAAVPATGTWRGDHSQVFDAVFPGSTPISYKTKMVIVEYDRRIASVAGYVRMDCQSILAVRDARVVQGWRIGRGPKVSRRGAFAFRADGAYIHGTLSRSSAVGGTLATYGSGPDGPECRGVGRFNLQRRW